MQSMSTISQKIKFQSSSKDLKKKIQVSSSFILDLPLPRSGCAASTDGKNIYVFGGKDAENRMNDIWEFSMTNYRYKKIEPKGHIPAERNGHSMVYHQGKFYVFGGIHDITW